MLLLTKFCPTQLAQSRQPFFMTMALRKTCKTDLAHLLEQDVLVSPTLPIFDVSKTTYIRDGMALLQSVDVKKYRNFGELAMDFVRHQVASFQFVSMVADIFDRYDIKNSIKSAERERRSKSFFTTKVFQVIEGRIIPDWKKFLSSGENIVIDKISW